MRGKRLFSIFICIALLFSLLPYNAYAATDTTLHVGGESYALQSGSCRVSGSSGGYARYFYSDGYFAAPPAQYNDHLAVMSLNMAISAMYSSDSEYFFRHAPIRQLLADIGCGDGTIRVNKEALIKPTETSIAFAMGYKKLSYADGTNTGSILLPIAVRGGGYEAEWCSNFTVGTQGEAEGFASAADRVCEEVQQYLADYRLLLAAESGQVKFWLVGYSRGAAVANLAAKRLVDEYGADAVYAYTWETPMGGISSAELVASDYSGIHNMLNYADLVTCVAPQEMGFKRYGTDHFFPSAEPEEYAEQVAAMKEQLFVLAPYMDFDDSFSLAAFSLSGVTSGEFITSVPYAHSDSVNHFAGDWLRLLLSKMQDWSITSRQKYAAEELSLGKASYPTIQEAVAAIVGIGETISGAQEAAVIDALDTVISEISALEKLNLYLIVQGWRNLSAAEKRRNIETYWAKFVSAGGLDAFDAPTSETIAQICPTLLCMALDFVSTDLNTSGSNLGYRGIQDKAVLIGTLAESLPTLFGNHEPLLTLAWARSFDSFYSDETVPCSREKRGTLTAPTLCVSGTAASTNQDAPTAVRRSEPITLDVAGTQGETICYTLDTVSAPDETRRLYCGAIDLPVEAETIYRLTVYAVFYGEKSAEATYYLTNAPSCSLEAQVFSGGVRYRADSVGMGTGVSRVVAAAYRNGRLEQLACANGPALSGGTVSGILPLKYDEAYTYRLFYLDGSGKPLTEAQQC